MNAILTNLALIKRLFYNLLHFLRVKLHIVSSDHNYFGVCQGILAPNAFSVDIPDGLLHSIPDQIRTKFPLLPRLVTECGTPTAPGGRFEAAEQLSEILKQI